MRLNYGRKNVKNVRTGPKADSCCNQRPCHPRTRMDTDKARNSRAQQSTIIICDMTHEKRRGKSLRVKRTKQAPSLLSLLLYETSNCTPLPRSQLQVHCKGNAFCTWPARIQGKPPDYSEGFLWSSSQSLQANAWLVLQLGHDHFHTFSNFLMDIIQGKIPATS